MNASVAGRNSPAATARSAVAVLTQQQRVARWCAWRVDMRSAPYRRSSTPGIANNASTRSAGPPRSITLESTAAAASDICPVPGAPSARQRPRQVMSVSGTSRGSSFGGDDVRPLKTVRRPADKGRRAMASIAPSARRWWRRAAVADVATRAMTSTHSESSPALASCFAPSARLCSAQSARSVGSNASWTASARLSAAGIPLRRMCSMIGSNTRSRITNSETAAGFQRNVSLTAPSTPWTVAGAGRKREGDGRFVVALSTRAARAKT
mmetsp:Transcript_27449/g.85127  ORF Transcript_27449/g.85127 Transcript_27449/m.85127 type:complete len:267 (-) Transcript_27449:329-1129(-)